MKRKCGLCGNELPHGKHQPHCGTGKCDWYCCPCGKTYDLKRHVVNLNGPLPFKRSGGNGDKK